MSQTERLGQIDQLLHDRKVVSFAQLQDALGVSRATLKRNLEYMRCRLNAPIEWSREAGGYRFASGAPTVGPAYALPGLWFNERETHALLTMQHLLSNLGADGILQDHIGPLMARLNALLKGRRVRLAYAARSMAEVTERGVSLVRLVHHRENWYLDAWCHLRQELRNFSVDRIERLEVTDKAAKPVSQRSLHQALGPGYGIFAQGKLRWARLRFTAARRAASSTAPGHGEHRRGVLPVQAGPSP